METRLMKRTLLAGAATASLALTVPGMARAQIPVTDALANAQAQITNSQLYQQVAQAVATVRQLGARLGNHFSG
ncbi:hypothetical protein LPC08_26010 (plasmid) [Roseomonas sp. OT10]|uniref:hypothetical protein n=1 Tax=Roseomonas cutis TaxID=2897332 RepID=UPI001E37DC97|nr:hypothetical protein [Roseomonas sp. OT10]UFN51808.1 hypothetical protein LPC08_26010 [Roseomonas sp. OT10]